MTLSLTPASWLLIDGALTALITDHDMAEPSQLVGQTVDLENQRYRVLRVWVDATVRDARGTEIRVEVEVELAA